MYVENDKSYRNTYLVKKIENDKRSLVKDIALLGASALAVGAGVLGIFLLKDGVINSFTSGDALTLKSYTIVRFQGSGLAISVGAILVGIIGAIENYKNAILSFKNLKRDEETLELLEERGKSR